MNIMKRLSPAQEKALTVVYNSGELPLYGTICNAHNIKFATLESLRRAGFLKSTLKNGNWIYKIILDKVTKKAI